MSFRSQIPKIEGREKEFQDSRPDLVRWGKEVCGFNFENTRYNRDEPLSCPDRNALLESLGEVDGFYMPWLSVQQLSLLSSAARQTVTRFGSLQINCFDDVPSRDRWCSTPCFPVVQDIIAFVGFLLWLQCMACGP